MQTYSERIQLLNDLQSLSFPEFVVYWLHSIQGSLERSGKLKTFAGFDSEFSSEGDF